jgi:6-phosphogluconolactonase/glucosamine-6-phosphate isomerase/deaminase
MRRVLQFAAADMRMAAKSAVSHIIEAVGQFEHPRVALCGGSTPDEVWEELVRWKIELKTFGNGVFVPLDERVVDSDSDEFNLNGLRVKLFDPFGISLRQVRWYDPTRTLAVLNKAFCYAGQKIEILFAGVGGESSGRGHIASLFPGDPALESNSLEYLEVVQAQKMPPKRITLPPRIIRATPVIVEMIKKGDGREGVLREALCSDTDFRKCPARMFLDYVPINGTANHDPLLIVITDIQQESC